MIIKFRNIWSSVFLNKLLKKMTSTNAQVITSNIKTNIEYLEIPDKSDNDKKEYRVIKLKNGLTALLIQDVSIGEDGAKIDMEVESEKDYESGGENASCSEDDSDNDSDASEADSFRSDEKMAACSLTVSVGSFSDPIHIQGLAHFLEHMVFMGSEKYPQENDFDSFIKQRGGSLNASTDMEHTTFYFDIPDKHLLLSLDRFAQFFTSPLLDKGSIIREREAVESEFKMSLLSDSNRKEQLFCSLADKNHPVSKFSWGNLISLRDNIDEEILYSDLHKFRERHYSAHRMTLAVQAKLSLDVLEKYVVECFSDVPVNWLSADDFSNFKNKEALITKNFCKFYKIKAIKDVCQLELKWILPSLLHLYKFKPHQYASWILGHEGKGSLISYLRKKMWCLDITSGNKEDDLDHNSMYALFSITLILTDDGKTHYKEVLDAVFSYINLLKKEGPQRILFDEIQKIEEMSFRFSNEIDPIENVENLSENMHLFPSKDYITGNNLFFDYDPDLIQSCIRALNPKDVNILFLDNKLDDSKFDHIEPWFQTKYSSCDILPEWIDLWNSIQPYPEFHHPNLNKFITTDFSLIKFSTFSKYPEKLISDERIEIWYKPDQKFRLPECYINLFLISIHNFQSAKSAAMVDLFLEILRQLSTEELYDATVARLNYSFYNDTKGIIVRVYGFNEKLSLLLITIMQYISSCHKVIDINLFNTMKQKLLKKYHNLLLKPKKLNKDIRLSILQSIYWTMIDKYSALTNIQFTDFIKFVEHYCDELYIQCLAQGNISRDELLKTMNKCTEILKYKPLSMNIHSMLKINQIESGEKFCKVKNFNAKDENSVTTNYYQSDCMSIQLSVIIEILMMIMEEPLYNRLRTQEQLGYHILCEFNDTYNVLGFSIIVCSQATKFTSTHVNLRIEDFLQYLLELLHNMPEDEFDLVKTSLITLKQNDDVQLRDELDRNWYEITSRNYLFDRRIKEISEINKVTKKNIIEWLQCHIVNGKNFKKLSIQVVGCDLTSDNNEESNHNDVECNADCKITFLPPENNEVENKSLITNIKEYKNCLKPFM